MDITPQVINEVEFHQKMRGYDPDEVDDFLERVAVAVGAMHDRLQDAVDRLGTAERRAEELESRLKDAMARGGSVAPGPSTTIDEDAETMRRTLVLAQRTADAAIAEAEERARQTIVAAEQQAAEHADAAAAAARKLLADAESEAHAASAATRERLVAEILELEESRDALRSDGAALERYLDEQRLRLRTTVADLQRLLEDPARLQELAPPAAVEWSRPAAVEEAGAVAPEPERAAASEVVLPSDELESDEEPVVDLADDEARVSGGVTYTAADDTGEHDAFRPTPSEDAAWARFVGDDGPPTEAVNLDDDAYLAELRKAMNDGDAEAWGEELSDRKQSRFGRRR